VDEEEGWAAALADVVVAQAVYRSVFVVEAIGLAQWEGSYPGGRAAIQVNFIR
jgi:hypothetical protein